MAKYTEGKIWKTSVDQLLELFRAGLIAVAPVADRAHINWADGSQYDDWDAIADGLYEGIVRMSVLHSTECRGISIPRYGFWPSNHERYYISVKDKSGTSVGMFVSFSSRDTAFSHVRVQSADEQGTESTAFFRFDECVFVLVDNIADSEFSELSVQL